MQVIQSAKLTGTPGNSGWSQIHEFAPEDRQKLAARGKLFAVVATTRLGEAFTGVDEIAAGRELVARLHEEYFGDLTTKPFKALSHAVEKVADEFVKTWGNVEIVASALVGNIVYSAAFGGGRILISRKGAIGNILSSGDDSISREVSHEYNIAQNFASSPIPLAKDTASKVEGLISVIIPEMLNSGLAKFIRENEAKYGPNDWHVALNAAIATADSKFVSFKDRKDAIEAGIRVGLAYMTLGIVSAPLEGFIRAELKKRQDGGEFISCFFGGPIRGAGGTAAASVIVIADALRAHFNIGKYDPTEEEVGRVKIEASDYDEYEARLQYLPTANELDLIWRNIPIEVEGDPTTDREVSAYKNIPRIKTNRIRGGAMLVLCEGFASKSQKVNKVIKSFGEEYKISDDLAFLDKYIALKEKEHTEENSSNNSMKVLPNYRYLEELAAGRPVFSYPPQKAKASKDGSAPKNHQN